jgi:large subunit ribosomal protein L2
METLLMGKRIRVQRRGRGGSTYRASTHKRVAPAQYPVAITPQQSFDTCIKGVIEALVHDPGRGAPLAFVRFENGETCYTITSEGVYEGQQISVGGNS